VRGPQSAILPETGENALFLVLKVERRRKNARAVADAAARVPGWTLQLERERRTRLGSAIAFGRRMWDAVSPDARPEGFEKFRARGAGEHHAPATGGDLLLHAVSREAGACFDLARRLRRELGGIARVKDEVKGFRYRDHRDLTGFGDGTENPSGSRRARVALLPEGHAFADGSFVLAQRYVHDLDAWEALPVEWQERVIGRTKPISRELPDRAKPPTAHIARVSVDEDGRELEIVRHGLPYGDTSEHGLFFLAYTNDLSIPGKMLGRMFGTSGDGRHDRLLRYTRPVSGAHFFAPSLDTLRRL
jgi:putative iron-dependent peroxidase